MGLLDMLGGMRGPGMMSGGGPFGGGMFGGGGGMFGGGGGMSPVTGAVLGLLAYKAYKSFSANSSTAPGTPAGQGVPASPQGGIGGALAGTPLGGLLGGLGGMLGGGNGGGILSGGLGDLMKQFQQAGHGPTADSWVSTGQNKPIAPQDLNGVLSEEQVSFLMQRTGLSRDELLAGLAKQLPQAIDQMTPNGRLPNEKETAALL
jgi:uncharacterized protein YidB (DUF937 family)